jgi:TNF receptor-associated protein 1
MTNKCQELLGRNAERHSTIALDERSSIEDRTLGEFMEKHQFQAEIQQLLNIVVHSLYTDKEIFIRELISNAADALEKLRFLQTSGKEIYQPDLPLKISIQTDEAAGTVTFTDTGIGMNHDEVVENLGTIAHSGSKAFLQSLTQEKKPDLNLIGQFGVGFYSAFMVAKKVEVTTRSYLPNEQGWKWISEGVGGYEMEPAPDAPRGTAIVVHLSDEQKEFAKPHLIESNIRRYSNFVPLPIEVNGKVINTVQAIWARNKNEIKDEEYDEFYKYIGHDAEKPMYRLHFNADAPLAIQALLYVPSHNIEGMGMARIESEVHLYCRKILIQSKAKGLLPDWLRFLRGVVDSEDLPLNISRETMQDTTLMQKLNRVLASRFIKFLEEQSTKDTVQYNKFFQDFGRFIKEGIVTDFAHREPLGKLLRYESSTLPKGEKTSLADYIKRMPSEQKDIYYLLAPNREAAETSPYYEVFAARKLEVLFFYDPWDEFVMDHLREFEGKSIQSAERADLKIESQPTGDQLPDDKAKDLGKWIKDVLKDRVNEVRPSDRLVDSPAVVTESEPGLTTTMRKVLRSMRKEGDPEPEMKFNLEINPRHPIITRLDAMRVSDPSLAEKVAEQLYDNARVAAGVLEDPRTMLKRLNELLEKVLTTTKT